MIDLAAAELDMDPADVRRKNFIPSEQVSSFITATGVTLEAAHRATRRITRTYRES
jgi:CO/xanthine dehydrogenase Mo-binding subunit